jgi:hypothetical protein
MFFLKNLKEVFLATLKEIKTLETTAGKIEKLAWKAEQNCTKREREIACINIIHELKKNGMIKEQHILDEIKRVRNENK